MENKYIFNKKFSTLTESKYKGLLAKLGIHYYFIPTKWNIEYLESPITMLKNNILGKNINNLNNNLNY